MLLAVSFSDDRLKLSLHLFFGEVECPLGSAACLLEPSLVRLASLCQVGSFQPRFEIGVHAHWRFSFRTVSRIWMSTRVRWSLLGRSFVVDHAHGLVKESLPQYRFVRHGGYKAPALRMSVGVSGGDSSARAAG
jgi:hypothetical protein